MSGFGAASDRSLRLYEMGKALEDHIEGLAMLRHTTLRYLSPEAAFALGNAADALAKVRALVLKDLDNEVCGPIIQADHQVHKA